MDPTAQQQHLEAPMAIQRTDTSPEGKEHNSSQSSVATSEVGDDRNNNESSFASKTEEASCDDLKEIKRPMILIEGRASKEENTKSPIMLEKKIALWSLLQLANVESDWTWDEASGVISNDLRFADLKTWGEREEAFKEYLNEQRKREDEEKNLKLKKSCDNFVEMLEERKELTPSTEWIKVIHMFRSDERFMAIERSKDRLQLFQGYCLVLQKKDDIKNSEGHKAEVAEYRGYLESRDFIKPNSKWKEVRKLLDDDKTSLKLEKIYRSDVFHEYLLDLQNEERAWMQKEKARQAEKKKSDDFCNMIKKHMAEGRVDTKTEWADYCAAVKESEIYIAISSTTVEEDLKKLFTDVQRQRQLEVTFS